MIGVLALQGDYEKHLKILDQLEILSKEIRYPQQLESVDGLIIPGGESTTINDLMLRVGFHDSIRAFAVKKPILGTCAGLIMMASIVRDSKVEPLGILDIEVDRNAYGRQVHSFTDQLSVSLDRIETSTRATFIRAPKIDSIGSSVEIVSQYNGKPVVVKENHHVGMAFHPELDGITLFHDYTFKKQFEKTHAA